MGQEVQYYISAPRIMALSSRAQTAIFRKIYDSFRKNISGMQKDNAYLRQYFGKHAEIADSIDTLCGRVDILISASAGFDFAFLSSHDIPKGRWRVGQLMIQALSAIAEYYKPNMIGIYLNDNRSVLDLIAVNVSATLGRTRKSTTVGFIPRHYASGAVIKSSDEAIKDIEQEVADELTLNNSAGQIKYETKIAYAWHRRHGILPAFVNGRVPRGLEAELINRGVIPVGGVGQN